MIPTIYTRDEINLFYTQHINDESEVPDTFTVGYHYGDEYTAFGKRIVSPSKTLVIVRHRTLDDGRVLQRCTLRKLDVDYSPKTDITQWMENDVPRQVLVTEDPQEALVQYNQLVAQSNDIF